MATNGSSVVADDGLRKLIKMARERAGLSQSQAATRAFIGKAWYKRIERIPVSVSVGTMLSVLNAVSVTPDLLRKQDQEELADYLEEQQRVMGLASPYTDELERYLWNAPADQGLRLFLIACSRTVRELQANGSEHPDEEIQRMLAAHSDASDQPVKLTP
jgi:transcriptional regulator with XRE-family HTH domain